MPSNEALIGAAKHISYELWMRRKLDELIIALPDHLRSDDAIEEAESVAITHTTHAEAHVWGEIDPSSGSPAERLSVLHNALIESFAIHARVLLDFFYGSTNSRNQDDVFPEHFFLDAEMWRAERPYLSDEDKKLIKRRVGKEIAHLTYARQKVELEDKPWPISDIVDVIDAAAKKFFDMAPIELLRPDRFSHVGGDDAA